MRDPPPRRRYRCAVARRQREADCPGCRGGRRQNRGRVPAHRRQPRICAVHHRRGSRDSIANRADPRMGPARAHRHPVAGPATARAHSRRRRAIGRVIKARCNDLGGGLILAELADTVCRRRRCARYPTFVTCRCRTHGRRSSGLTGIGSSCPNWALPEQSRRSMPAQGQGCDRSKPPTNRYTRAAGAAPTPSRAKARGGAPGRAAIVVK